MPTTTKMHGDFILPLPSISKTAAMAKPNGPNPLVIGLIGHIGQVGLVGLVGLGLIGHFGLGLVGIIGPWSCRPHWPHWPNQPHRLVGLVESLAHWSHWRHRRHRLRPRCFVSLSGLFSSSAYRPCRPRRLIDSLAVSR